MHIERDFKFYLVIEESEHLHAILNNFFEINAIVRQINVFLHLVYAKIYD